MTKKHFIQIAATIRQHVLVAKERMSAKDFNLHASGIAPAQCPKFEAIARAAIKSGCNLLQARCLAVMAYNAANGFHWSLPAGSGIAIHTQLRRD